jgi:Mg-chelatase subunit ChlD/uncharacterized membrane protein
MRLSFTQPIALVLLALVPLLLFLARGKLTTFSRRQRAVALVTRGMLFTALVLALADTRLGLRDDHLELVVAIDDSASVDVAAHSGDLAWAHAVESQARSDDRVRQIHFGRWASAASTSAGPPTDATNLADALQLAGDLLPNEADSRVVLLSDGQQNVGEAQEAATRLAERGVQISYARPDSPLPVDVLVRSVEAPAYLREGEVAPLGVLIGSSRAADASLRLFIDDRLVDERTVTLAAGDQRLPVMARAGAIGFHRWRAEVQLAGDSRPENDAGEAYSVVRPSGRVLLLENRVGEAGPLEQVLRESGLETEIRPASAIPPSAGGLQAYDSIVAANLPSTALTLDQQTTLQSFVQDYGRGLVVTGGNTSYALGGYGASPLGEVLPVDPTPPTRRGLGSVALFLVIDKSSSMELFRGDTSKMSMAREAAMLAVEALNPDDQVAVLAFDTRFQWVVPPTRLSSAADKARVKASIATIKADGGTSIYPALEAAYEAAASTQARLKHIVLLTDGQSPDGDYANLIARMQPRTITLTSVAVGADSDTALLSRIATLGDGRYYFTERPEEIPRIITRESSIVSRNALVEGLVRPRVVQPSALLAELQDRALPDLGGYIATSVRPSAETVLSSDSGDPLLATWQYGLGRVVAWTSDARGDWSRDWLNTPEARRVWGQLTRWSMSVPTDPSFQLSSTAESDRVTLRVDALDPNGSFADGREMRAIVTTPRGERLQLPLRQVAAGSYETTVQATQSGVYQVRADEMRSGQAIRGDDGGFVVVAVPELRTIGPNLPLLAQLAQATGGRELSEPGEALSRDGAWRATRWLQLWPALLVVALLLLPLDVAARRLSLFRR